MLPQPRIVWLMVPAGDATEATHGGVRRAACRRATPSSTAATPTSRTPSAATRCSTERGHRGSSTPASPAASGGSRTATARWSAATARPSQPLEPIFRALAPEGGYVHCGPPGAGPLHQDGPQRHRVRADAGLRRGLRDPPRLGVPARPRGRRQGLAARHRHPLVAAGAGRPGLRAARRGPRATSAAGSPTRARAAGRCRRPWTSTCRRRSSRSRCWPASAAARTRATAPRSSPRCASSSAATP